MKSLMIAVKTHRVPDGGTVHFYSLSRSSLWLARTRLSLESIRPPSTLNGRLIPSPAQAFRVRRSRCCCRIPAARGNLLTKRKPKPLKVPLSEPRQAGSLAGHSVFPWASDPWPFRDGDPLPPPAPSWPDSQGLG